MVDVKGSGMGKHDLMKDPYFAGIMFRIESCIFTADNEARGAAKCIPKDSAAKSALRKAKLALEGRKPVKPPKGALEEWIMGLSDSLVGISREMDRDERVPTSDFARMLDAACNSLDTRREMEGSPRGYLDFLEGFIKQAGGG